MTWIKQGNIFNKHHAQVPVVDTYDAFYRIYYSTRIEGKSHPMFIDVEKNTFKIINESKEPIAPPGKPGSFDWAGVMPTEIINIGNTKHLYYIGWSNRLDVPYHNNVGLMFSLDNGNTWAKKEGPVLHTSSSEPGYVGTLAVIKNHIPWEDYSKYLGYYLSCRDWENIEGRMEPIYDIKLAYSEDLFSWEPQNKVCIPLKENEGGISKASILHYQDKYRMWFSYRGKYNYRTKSDSSYRIGYAESIDGVRWNRKEDIELNVSESGWDSEMVAYPHVVKEDNRLIMFYNGNKFGNTGIGYAIKEL
jgi:hypothetical protein